MEPQSQYDSPWQRYRLKLIVAVLMLIAGYLVYFIGTHGFLIVELSGSSGGQQTVVILDQKSNQSSTKIISGNNLRKFVKKSNYEILVRGSSGSAWGQATTKGFLLGRSVQLQLSPEKSRTFVADSPAGCMVYDQQLLSFGCTSPLEGANLHEASTATLPPLVSAALADVEGAVQSIVNTPSGVVALSTIISDDNEDADYIYQFVSLGSGTFKAGQVYRINGLNPRTTYQAKPYRQGVLVYSQSFDDLVYFSNISTAGQKISLPAVEDKLRPVAIETSTNSLIVTYQNQAAEAGGDSTTKPKEGARSAATVLAASQSAKTYYFDEAWSSIISCGDRKICATVGAGDKGQLIVTDIANDKPKRLFAINNVSQIVSLADEQILVITTEGILRLDTAKRSASLDYSLVGYSFCGLGQSRLAYQYTVCVSDSKGSYALLIDSKIADKNQIDIKATKLRSSPFIEAAIIDRSRILILPKYGEPVYNEAEKSFLPDPKKVAEADQAIVKLINEAKLTDLGFDITTNY